MANPYAGISFGEGTDAPLAGMDPLQTISGATTINATGALGINFARFTSDSGMLHTSPVLPVAASEAASFAEIAGQITSIVATDGASVVIGDPDLLEAP